MHAEEIRPYSGDKNWIKKNHPLTHLVRKCDLGCKNLNSVNVFCKVIVGSNSWNEDLAISYFVILSVCNA